MRVDLPRNPLVELQFLTILRRKKKSVALALVAASDVAVAWPLWQLPMAKTGDLEPKFGHWENNIPYTLYFELKGKKREKANQNQGEETEEAFSNSSSPKTVTCTEEPTRLSPKQRIIGNDVSPIPVRHVASGDGFAVGSPHQTPGKSPLRQKAHAPTIPVFGEWNQKGVPVNENYSIIFSDLSKEKKSAFPLATYEKNDNPPKTKTPSCACIPWLWK
ncbi:uncharacterized protein LOC144711449 isoform X2 [Wolffia australiana]